MVARGPAYAAPVPGATPPPSSCCTPPTPRTASAARPARCSPGVAPRATGSPSPSARRPTSYVRCSAPARVGLIPVLLNATLTPAERDDLADDARPTVRIFTQRGPGPTSSTRASPTDLAPVPAHPPHALHVGHDRPAQGRHDGLWDEATARAVFEDEAAVWHFDPDDLHMVCSPMYHTVVDPLRQQHAAGRRVAGHPEPLRRRDRARCPAPPPPDHRLPRPDPPAADPAVPRPRRRRDVRLVAPPRPRRRALPRVGQAGHHGPGPARRASGSSTARPRPSSRSARPRTGSSTPARSAGPAPAAGSHRPGRRSTPTTTIDEVRGRHHLVRHARLRPLQLLGRPRRHGGRLARVGLHRRRPRPPRSGRLPLPDRPAPRPHHQRRRQRLPRRGRERAGRRRRRRRGGRLRRCPTSNGASGSAPPTSPRPSAAVAPRRPCGPPPRPASPRTSGPRPTSPPPTCPTRPPAS